MPASLGILSVGRTRGGFRIRVEGRGTMRESPAVREFARQAMEPDNGSLLVDLSGCDYLDSTFLGCLIGLHKRFGVGSPPRFAVVAPPAARERLLAPLQLDRVLNIDEQLPEVLGDEVAIPPQALEGRDLGRHVLECHRRLAELGGLSGEVFGPIVEQLSEELGARGD